MQYLRYNTDSQEVVFGIFVDSTDGNTEETGLTIANTDIKIWKTGATTLANKNSGGATHISNGIYYAVFDATDTNTLGSGKAFVHVSGALYCVIEFCVLPQKVYDSMIAGSDNLEVDAIQIEGTDATDQINSACDTAISDAGVTTTRMGYVDYLANATYGLSAIETLVDEIKTKTDQLTFTTANKVDATATIEGGDATAANQTTIINHLIGIKGSTFSEETDSLEAIRDRGDAAWTTGGGASGSNAITITITDTDDVNIIDAAVEIWDSVGTSFVERKSSNSSGQAAFNLDDGIYTVKIHKTGYSIDNQTLVVSGTASITYQMTAYIIPAPASAELCRVYDYFYDLSGVPLSRLTGTATIQSYYQDSNGYYYSEENGIYNSDTGVLYFDLVKGCSVVIDIPGAEVSKTITVPSTDTARLKDL